MIAIGVRENLKNNAGTDLAEALRQVQLEFAGVVLIFYVFFSSPVQTSDGGVLVTGTGSIDRDFDLNR
jgi:hypothetical protein